MAMADERMRILQLIADKQITAEEGVQLLAGLVEFHLAFCERLLQRREPVGPHTVKYLNRLSDALFVMARHENKRHGVPDILWNSRA